MISFSQSTLCIPGDTHGDSAVPTAEKKVTNIEKRQGVIQTTVLEKTETKKLERKISNKWCWCKKQKHWTVKIED